MNKEEFLSELRTKLSGLPQEDIEERISFYSEMIDDRIDEGMDEEAAVAAVGHLDDIEARIHAERQQPVINADKGRKKLSPGALTAIVVACIILSPLLIGILGAAIGIVFGILGAAFGIFVALIAVYVSFYILKTFLQLYIIIVSEFSDINYYGGFLNEKSCCINFCFACGMLTFCLRKY